MVQVANLFVVRGGHSLSVSADSIRSQQVHENRRDRERKKTWHLGLPPANHQQSMGSNATEAAFA